MHHNSLWKTWKTLNCPQLCHHLSAVSRFLLHYTEDFPWGHCPTSLLPVSSACWPLLKRLIKHKMFIQLETEDSLPFGEAQLPFALWSHLSLSQEFFKCLFISALNTKAQEQSLRDVMTACLSCLAVALSQFQENAWPLVGRIKLELLNSLFDITLSMLPFSTDTLWHGFLLYDSSSRNTIFICCIHVNCINTHQRPSFSTTVRRNPWQGCWCVRDYKCIV